MVLIDAALGLPAAFLRAAGHDGFLSWLLAAQTDAEALRPVDRAADWSVRRPFFRVPPGAGSRTAFEARAQLAGAALLRDQERKLDAKSAFIVSGIPGTVGSGTLALWNELLPLMPGARTFALAPFEGQPPELIASGRIVLAEMYPRACYSAALRDAPAPRHKQRVEKSVRSCARAAVDALEASKWVKRLGVQLRDLDAARESEHELDALLSAAGLLRALLDGEPLYDEHAVDARAEGMLFGSGGLRDVEPWAPCPCRRPVARRTRPAV
jgi:hypothetical protein